jgi:uncharacterized protein YutD
MKEITINALKYRLEKDYREAFDEKEVADKLTDYYYNYDYIVGDWAYGKLRLKGFYESNSKNVTAINNIKELDEYIANNCAYGCKYFVLRKI